MAAAYYQIDLVRVKPHKFVSLVYAWAIERVPPDNLDKWLADLEDLLPWQDLDSDEAVQSESDSFMQAMSTN